MAYTAQQQIEFQARQFSTLQGERIGYITAGDPQRPPLLLVHGWLAHANFWRRELADLAASHYCIAIDLLGFGFSAKPANGDYSIPAQARRVLALADALGVERFALMGHSMGGQISLYTTLLAPQRVTQVVTVGGVVEGALTPYFKAIFGLPLLAGYYVPASWYISRVGMRRWRWYKRLFVDRSLTYLPDVVPLGSPDIEMALIAGIERPAYQAFHGLQACDLTPRLPEIQTPVLIIHGEQDNTVPVSSGRLAASRIANSHLLIFDPCGHQPNMEVPDQFCAAVRAFLGD